MQFWRRNILVYFHWKVRHMIEHQLYRPTHMTTLWMKLQMFYLKAMFPPPPARVFFRRHVYDWHNVPNLLHKECHQGHEVWLQLSTLKWNHYRIRYISYSVQPVIKTLPQRSTRLWPELCNVWWRVQQQWQGHWLRLLQIPTNGSPCCRSKNKNNHLNNSLTAEEEEC